eukprot:109334_1
MEVPNHCVLYSLHYYVGPNQYIQAIFGISLRMNYVLIFIRLNVTKSKIRINELNTMMRWNTGLLLIHEQLKQFNESIRTFGFDIPDVNDCLVDTAICSEIREELDYDENDCRQLYKSHESQFNEEQRKVYFDIKNSIDNGDTDIGYYIDGVAGAGKSFIANALLAYVRSTKHIALSVAGTGIASTLLMGGRTFHSRFKCRNDINHIDCRHEYLDIGKGTGLAKLLKQTKLIIIDEITTLSKLAYECLNRTLQFIMDSDALMGGLLVVLMGDFKQCLPIVEGAFDNDAAVINSCVNHSCLWAKFKQYKLVKNMRLDKDDIDSQLYAQQILDIGNGVFPTQTIGDKKDLIRLPDEWLSSSHNLDDFIDETYNDMDHHYKDPSYFANTMMLTPLNETVRHINEKVLAKFPGPELEPKLSEDKIIDDSYFWDYPTERLNAINIGGLPLHELNLKTHAPVILLRNIAQRDGLCNGTRMVIDKVLKNVIVCKLLNGSRCGQIAFIHRIKLNQDNTKSLIPFQRFQYPLQLAFAISCNKSQGQSIKRLGLYLPVPVFAHGQLYTSLSRIKNRNNLNILIENTTEQGTFDGYPGVYTRNIVLKGALNEYVQNNPNKTVENEPLKDDVECDMCLDDAQFYEDALDDIVDMDLFDMNNF